MIGSKGFGEVAGAAVLESVRCQGKVGVDIVTDGEQRGDNFYPFVTDKPGGVKLTFVSDLLMYVPGRPGSRRLRALDVPAFAVKSAAAVGRLEERLRIRERIKCRS
jgi:methionine synthase II (cobalamin-independent)